MKKSLYLFTICSFLTASLFAGNPDRQGEAGAVQAAAKPLG